MDATTNSFLTADNKVGEELKKESQHLHDIMKALRGATENESAMRNHTHRFVLLLCDLRDQLAIYFALKEKGGYFAEAVEASPRLSENVERLKEQNREIFSLGCRLVELAEQEQQSGRFDDAVAEIIKLFQAFDHAFTAHERNESSVIVNSVDVDLGGGD